LSPKDQPGRLAIATYPLRFETRILYSDMDGFRHLNNGATGRYLEEGRAAFNIRVFGVGVLIDPVPGEQLLFANVNIDFVRQAHYPGSVEIGTGVARIGTSSYILGQAAFQNGECFAVCEAVMVKARDGRPTPLDAQERAVIETLMLRP
jgi:acyl-CoA thioester hydrolase